MMRLSRGQCYCISLCEEKYSIRLSFVLSPGENNLAELRKELLEYFESKLKVVMEDFMNATSKAVAYFPCCYCSQLHAELQMLLEGEIQDCPNKLKPLPDHYYYDLVTDQGL